MSAAGWWRSTASRREVVFSPGSAPVKIDPNGAYMTGAMYAQYMVRPTSARHRPLADVAWRRADRGELGHHAGRTGGFQHQSWTNRRRQKRTHGDIYCFERGATKTSGGEGWADVWKRGCFGW